MGLTSIQAKIANPKRPRRSARPKFLVDSGELCSVVPRTMLQRLGIKPGRARTFMLADGTEIKRCIGEAWFRINGEEGDSTLLGMISLEALGSILDPLKSELRSPPMTLASHRPA